MNRRSLLRALGSTAIFASADGWLHTAAAQPAPPGHRPPDPHRKPGKPPHSNRPGFGPPPPRHDRRPPPPRAHGYLWTDGYWRWQHGRYIWVPGRWVARRPGHRWIPGYWRRQGHVWVYVDGYWR